MYFVQLAYKLHISNKRLLDEFIREMIKSFTNLKNYTEGRSIPRYI